MAFTANYLSIRNLRCCQYVFGSRREFTRRFSWPKPDPTCYLQRTVGKKLRGRYDGMPRRHWSRLETRAKEHSVKASRKVLLNLVASESEWRSISFVRRWSVLRSSNESLGISTALYRADPPVPRNEKAQAPGSLVVAYRELVPCSG